jgi:hypothetical protein
LKWQLRRRREEQNDRSSQSPVRNPRSAQG